MKYLVTEHGNLLVNLKNQVFYMTKNGEHLSHRLEENGQKLTTNAEWRWAKTTWGKEPQKISGDLLIKAEEALKARDAFLKEMGRPLTHNLGDHPSLQRLKH